MSKGQETLNCLLAWRKPHPSWVSVSLQCKKKRDEGVSPQGPLFSCLLLMLDVHVEPPVEPSWLPSHMPRSTYKSP